MTRPNSAGTKRRRSPRHQEERALWLFTIPSLLMISCVLLVPLGYAIGLSFTNYTLGAKETSFVGLENYGELLVDERFWTSLVRTLAIVSSAVALEFSLGLAIAFGLWKLRTGAQSLLTVFFIPYVITPAVAALFLKWMFMGRFGLVSGTLIGMGIFPPDFLGDPAWARITVVLADAWQFTPFMILTLYAGLNTVDESLIEAGRIDGAGNWTILFRIMLPNLRFLIVFVLAIRFMDAFRFFDTIYVLTAGGPGTATETITMYTYALAFRFLQVGKASALGVISLLVVALATVVMMVAVFGGRKREEGVMSRKHRSQAILFAVLLAMSVVNLTPVAWGFLTSIRQPVDAFAVPPKLIFEPTFQYHREVWVDRGFWHFLVNTAIISVCAVSISVSIGSMTAYALSRLRSRVAKGLLFGMLGMRMFPHVLLAIPFFVIAQLLGLIDTYLVMILAIVALNQPFTIWLMRSFFDELPKELYEAATIDGCTAWQTFRRVALPVVRPGIWVTTLFSLLLAYNEFLLALVLTRNSTKTMPVAISEYGAEDISYWSLGAAAAIGIMLPILIFMLLMQRHLVRGMSAGAVKG